MGAAQDILYRFDARKIKIISGDIPAGYWELHSCILERCECPVGGSSAGADSSSETSKDRKVDLDGIITRMSVKNVEDANPAANMLGVGVGALAGLRFFGPLGAIGGAVAGQMLVGNRHDVTVEVKLKNGTQFTATMDKNVYQRLQVVANRCSEYSEAN